MERGNNGKEDIMWWENKKYIKLVNEGKSEGIKILRKGKT